MKYVLAISGGMDSMLMLSMMAQDYEMRDNLVVAHYNHKMRPSADDDATFVKHWAEDVYNVPFYYGEAKPGEIKSEEQARNKRYAFLHRVAKETGGNILTAHHVNDMVETMAINVLRGTGWRGLSPFSDTRTHQFFFEFVHSKREILELADINQVVFRQDPTNTEDTSLRNRVREKIAPLDEEFFHHVWSAYIEQLELKDEIDGIIAKLLPKDGRYERAWFIKQLDYKSALEILRAGLLKIGISATRPQLMDFLMAIKNYAPEKKFNLPGGKMVTLHKTYFILRPEPNNANNNILPPEDTSSPDE